MQKLIIQTGSIEVIREILSAQKVNRILLVIARHIANKDAANGLLAPLSAFDTRRIIKSAGDVTKDETELHYPQCQHHQPEVVIAIGGGSTIDLAKCLLLKHIEHGLTKPCFIAVPTTAGSGSEATCFAVSYTNKTKYSLEHPSLLPEFAVLDHTLLDTLSPHQWAISGIDTIAHAIESFWNVRATAQSKALAAEAVSISIASLPEIRKRPHDVTLQAHLLRAAYQAGQAINITRTTGPHALSYHLTGYYDIPHGQAVALFLPVFVIYNATTTTAHPLQELNPVFNTNNSWEAAQFLQNLMREIGLKTRLSDYHFNTPSLIDDIIGNVNQERFRNNPVPLREEELKTICKKMLL